MREGTSQPATDMSGTDDSQDVPGADELATRDPQEVAAEAADLAARMEGDSTLRLDVAYQLVTGRGRIGELTRELDNERRRLDAALQMAPSASEPRLQRAIIRAVPWFLCFVGGLVAFVLLTVLLSVAAPCAVVTPRTSALVAAP